MDKYRHIIVYIAGPFRAPSNWGIAKNVRAAEEVAFGLFYDFTGICPHLNTINLQGGYTDEVWL